MRPIHSTTSPPLFFFNGFPAPTDAPGQFAGHFVQSRRPRFVYTPSVIRLPFPTATRYTPAQ